MSVDGYLHHTGLNRLYWHDPQLRVLVQLLLNIQKPATGPAERFLSGTVIMDDGPGLGSTGIVLLAGNLIFPIIGIRWPSEHNAEAGSPESAPTHPAT